MRTHTHASMHTDNPHRINCKKPDVRQRVPGLKIGNFCTHMADVCRHGHICIYKLQICLVLHILHICVCHNIIMWSYCHNRSQTCKYKGLSQDIHCVSRLGRYQLQGFSPSKWVYIPPSRSSICLCIPDVYVCIIMHMCTLMYYSSFVIECTNTSNLLENVLISVPVNFYVHMCIHMCTYVRTNWEYYEECPGICDWGAEVFKVDWSSMYLK